MTVKTSCSDCRRKISVNKVFAGGMCRCPYCRSLVFVPGEPAGRPIVERPEVPPDPGSGPVRGRVSNRVVVESALAITIALLAVAMAAIVVIAHFRDK